MNQAFPNFAHGRNGFRCVVCGEEKARVALQVGGKSYGLCSTWSCINNSKRDAYLNRLLPRCVSVRDAEIAFEWIGVVHAAWGMVEETTTLPNTQMRVINVNSEPDPAGRFDLGLG